MLFLPCGLHACAEAIRDGAKEAFDCGMACWRMIDLRHTSCERREVDNCQGVDGMLSSSGRDEGGSKDVVYHVMSLLHKAASLSQKTYETPWTGPTESDMLGPDIYIFYRRFHCLVTK